jgi:hypothetical protein
MCGQINSSSIYHKALRIDNLSPYENNKSLYVRIVDLRYEYYKNAFRIL